MTSFSKRGCPGRTGRLASGVPEDRRKQAEDIFALVAGLDPGERTAELSRLCGDNAVLYNDVQTLIRCSDAAPDFLEMEPITSDRLASFSDLFVPQTLPKQVGKFEILGLLGAGGMGIVYRARSLSPRRQVALKVIRPGIATGPMLRRFEYEAQVLARLKHAGIAQIYETGMADTGQGTQPYFAMELVEGRGLIEYAKQQSLGLRLRLELMASVCDAVHHAHENGVVHRDLKPLNILVDHAGQPKVLDFGVARLLESELGESRDALITMHTGAGQIVGTLAYMSPEQVGGDAAIVDGRADVYSLGVMLYELLCGRLPHDVSRMSLADAIQAVRKDTPASVAADNAALRGDIECIVGKAMAKEPSQRYQSAESLGDDIRNYLSDRTIAARPPSPYYAIRTFVRRNRAIVITASLALIGLSLGVVGVMWRAGVAVGLLAITSGAVGLAAALWQADRAKKAAARAMIEAGRAASEAARATHAAGEATREAARASAESERATSEQEIAEAVSAYLAALLESADPDVGRKHEVTVREMLDRSTVRSLSEEFVGKPRVLAKLHAVIGKAYEQLSSLDAAREHFVAGLDVSRLKIGTETLEHVTALNDLGHLYKLLDAFDISEPMLREAVRLADKVLGGDHRLTIDCKINLSSVLHRQERYAEAEKLLTDTTAAAERTLGRSHRTTHVSMNNLASAIRQQGDLQRAIGIRRRFLDLARHAFGDDNTATLMAMNNLATDLVDAGDPIEAESLLRETVTTRSRLLGADHRSTLNSQCNLAACLRSMRRYRDADDLMRSVMERAVRVIEPGNLDRAKFELEFARILLIQNHILDAEKYARVALCAYEAALGGDAKRTRLAAALVTEIVQMQGQDDASQQSRDRSSHE